MPTRTIRVEVTQEDIDKGERRSACSCPVALAIKRCAPVKFAVSVGRCEIGLASEFVAYQRIRVPALAQSFIDDFDSAGPALVKPFAFDLTLEAA